jgi:hypothetical protein
MLAATLNNNTISCCKFLLFIPLYILWFVIAIFFFNHSLLSFLMRWI